MTKSLSSILTDKQLRAFQIFLFFVSAVTYGEIEGTHVIFGPSTLFDIFIFNYHVPIALLLLIYAYALHCFSYMPLWILLEDMSFWIFSGKELMVSSWISMMLGGFTIFGAYLPWTYVLLFLVWVIITGWQYIKARKVESTN